LSNFVMVVGTAAALAFADTESFDQVRPGTLPPGWECGVTGRGSPHWAVEIDSSALTPAAFGRNNGIRGSQPTPLVHEPLAEILLYGLTVADRAKSRHSAG
jgi:hypothetical protein